MKSFPCKMHFLEWDSDSQLVSHWILPTALYTCATVDWELGKKLAVAVAVLLQLAKRLWVRVQVQSILFIWMFNLGMAYDAQVGLKLRLKKLLYRRITVHDRNIQIISLSCNIKCYINCFCVVLVLLVCSYPLIQCIIIRGWFTVGMSWY